MNAKQLSKILVPLMILTALLLAGCSSAQKDTASIRAVADKISGYSIPQGYSEQFALDVMGYQMVSLVGKTPNCHIYLVQAPKGTEADIARLEEQARSMEASKKNDRPRDVRVVENRTVTIRGQEVQMAVGEGTNSDNLPYREISALFDGRGGPTLVSVASPVDQWDWDQVNAFLASIE